MPKLGTEALTGQSGETYTFNAYDPHMRFNDFIPGIYCIVNVTEGKINAIFLDQCDNVDLALRKHEKQACFDQHGANRICFLKNASADVRQKIMADLLPALKPVCND